ncbi:MAG: fibronectin type III domain-containing protein, partial [Actinomycetota bacterium]
AGDRSVAVEWSAPAFTGGTPITGYTVTASPGGASCTWSSGPLRCTVAGLENTVAYTFVVTAANAVGAGEPSSASTAVTPATPMAATVDSALDAGLDLAPDGTVSMDLGCAGARGACSMTVSITYDGAVVASGTTTSAQAKGAMTFTLSEELQREIARRGSITVKVTVEAVIDGFKVKISSLMTLEAPPAQAMRELELRPTATGAADFGAACVGTMVQRCEGDLALYAEPAMIAPVTTRRQARVLIGNGGFGAAAGTGVRHRVELTPEGKAYLMRHGSMRVTPVLTLKGGTRVIGKLPKGFGLTMMTPEQWLRRAVATLSVGGRPRIDLNLLLDAHRAGRVSSADAARAISREIIPRRERALRRVEALPIPPRELRPIVVLLERSFAQSLAANHAYVRWLRSGVRYDDVAWRHSAKATQTKAALIERLNRAGRRYGVRVPAPTGLWP